MSYSFSGRSQKALSTIDPKLQAVLKEAIKYKDFTVLEGHRGRERQEKMYREGKSKLRFPQSKHNYHPARAVDIAPYPIDWSNIREFDYLAGLVVGIGAQMGINIRWGGDWDRDGELSDNGFNDLPHLELVD
ncbi:MAG: M15 family metallopeptidase [Pseudomonadota bacterium]